MRHARSHIPLFLGLALLLGGCLDQYQEHLGPLELDVVYHGSTDGRPLEAVILHSEVDNYDEADNLLTAPLEREDATRFTEVPTGTWYVTVIRKDRPLPDSPRIALTTAKPLDLHEGRWEIQVFDDFFRVMDPVQSDEATGDATW